MQIRASGHRRAVAGVFAALMLLGAAPLRVAPGPDCLYAQDSGDSGEQGPAQIKMGASLWETLIENGVNPAQWKEIFQYNKAHNPAFRRIRTAKAIPRGTVILLPGEGGARASAAAPARTGKRKAAPVPSGRIAVRDTVTFLDGLQFLEIDAGGRRHVNEIIARYCVPAGMTDSRARALLERSVVSDLKDLYHRMDREFAYRDRTFYLPLYLLAENHKSLENRIESAFTDPARFVPRDSLPGLDPSDLAHVAAAGETYRGLARKYAGDPQAFPERYPFRRDPEDHLGYMAQLIRHYNGNQPLWPGQRYYIPSWLPQGRYYDSIPEVILTTRTRDKLVYSNGLTVYLDNHVTRKKTYRQRREKYYPPLERKLADGSPAYPDMLLWHRTGLEPEIEEILRSRGKQHFSLRYIFRTAVANYYIDENGQCYLIVDPEKNARDNAGSPYDYRCFWDGEANVSDVSIGVEVEGWFQGDLSAAQLETALRLKQMLRSRWIIPESRVLDHRKVACRRGPDLRLERGRKADGLSRSDRLALGIQPVLDPDVLRGVVDPNLDGIQARQTDSLDYWFKVELDPDLEETAGRVGWRLQEGRWLRPGAPGAADSFPATK